MGSAANPASAVCVCAAAGTAAALAAHQPTTDWRYWPLLQVGEEPSAEKLQTMLREALERTSGPGALLWTTACTSLFGAWVAAWAGTFWGVDAYRLMHEVPGQAAAPEWLAWTVPYVAGTLGAYLLKPTSVTKVRLFGGRGLMRQWGAAERGLCAVCWAAPSARPSLTLSAPPLPAPRALPRSARCGRLSTLRGCFRACPPGR